MRLIHGLLVALLLVAFVFAAGCDDDDDDELEQPPANEATIELFSNSTTQDAEGIHAASGAEFFIPAGTYVYRVADDTVTFSVDELSEEAADAAPFTVIGGATFRPDYVEFATPVTIVIPAPGLAQAAHIYHYNVRETSQTGYPATWTDLGLFEPVNGLIEMEVEYFGSFVVGFISEHDQGFGGSI